MSEVNRDNPYTVDTENNRDEGDIWAMGDALAGGSKGRKWSKEPDKRGTEEKGRCIHIFL